MDLSGLNGPQREAVLHDGGPLVVFAGAGSGKTRVITMRIARLVAEQGVAPWRILAVTFTNKAAGEMRERLEHLVPGGAKGLQVGTFHSTCARLLRLNAEAAGVKKDFVIYDDQDQQAMVKRVMGDLNLDPKQLPPKQIAGAINRAKQEMTSPEEMATEGDPYREMVRRIYTLYEERMGKAGALDFGDLIYRFVRALEKNEELRQHLAGRFLHQLVDEFQDTNHAQLRLVRALASVHRNLVVVGDDDQSIYRWRGADRRNILDFRGAYPDARVVKLEQNYRSTQRILRVAHSVISKNHDREPKELWTENPEGDKVLVVRCEDERDEARMVVRGVQELQNKGASLAEVAVFYRTHAQSRVLEEGLRQANLPYRIVGGVRFYDRAEVKDLLAYLRVIQNPGDDISLMRIVNVPARGIGKTTLTRLLEDAARTGSSVWDAIDENAGSGPARKLAQFKEMMERLRSSAKTLPLEDLPGMVLDESGYLEMLRADDSPEADARRENLQELVGSIQQFAEEHDEPTLASFLEDVTLASVADEQSDGAKVTLMTVHAAKGLEFDTVMVTGLEERMFPMRGTDPAEDPEEMEEERRLAYVAFTRARQRLILSYASVRHIYGQVRPGDPSRFVLDVPREDAVWIGVEPRRSGMASARPYRPDPWDRPSMPARGGRGGWGTRSGRDEDAFDEPARDHADFGGSDDAWQPGSQAKRGRDDAESYVDYSEGSDMGGFAPGMRVRHPKFGVGEVRRVEQGMVPKADVIFPGWGKKTLAIQYLTPA
ncbi:MAG: UvrD-helicase domain-containing protein [Sandaracinus sp.]|nr:UvrD-helicase domain-containing protein [Sandaracinus sp.]